MVVASGDDFNAVVNSAHVALSRQPGPGTSMTPEIRSIAEHAKKMILNVRGVRNDFGTGHGRAKVVTVDAEMTSVVADATLLWVRWALRRLEHILIGEADLLIAELHGAVTRRSLQKHLDAVMLPDQPPEVQHALGAAFAQRAAGWTFVAREVGIDPCVTSEDLGAWPTDYRLGVVEGFVLNRWGMADLDPHWVPTLVNALLPLPTKTARRGLTEVTEKIVQSERGPATLDAANELADSIRTEGLRLPPEVQPAWMEFGRQFVPSPDLVNPE
ncbi:MAG: abortive infection family protein [Dermatophilaceae bacterium]